MSLSSYSGAGYLPMTQSYVAPNQAFAQIGAPAATVQAQAMQAVLQRVQELVIAHANVPSNAKHWSAVLETASEKMQGKASKANELVQRGSLGGATARQTSLLGPVLCMLVPRCSRVEACFSGGGPRLALSERVTRNGGVAFLSRTVASSGRATPR